MKRIIVGITAGIAAYKSAELVRQLVTAGHEVRVVMTAGAEHFVGATTFQALSGRPVRSALFDPAAEAAMSHIELARWADAVVVAPATADFIARAAGGFANDLLTTLLLATPAPVFLAPAMNQQMWQAPVVGENLAALTARGYRILGPADGAQACGDTGPGRMLEPDAIAGAVLAVDSGALSGLAVLVTAGPTEEPIDPVRFVSNRSSGRMGYAVAEAARDAGAEVTLVSGPVALAAPAGVTRIDVRTAREMHAAVTTHLGSIDIFVGAAAVADYAPQAETRKIKKDAPRLELAMTRTEDIIGAVSAHPERPFTVGFAAETDDLERYARAKLERKNLDLIAANVVGDGLGFDQPDNELLVIAADATVRLPRAAKADIARSLIDIVAERYRRGTQAAGVVAALPSRRSRESS